MFSSRKTFSWKRKKKDSFHDWKTHDNEGENISFHSMQTHVVLDDQQSEFIGGGENGKNFNFPHVQKQILLYWFFD